MSRYLKITRSDSPGQSYIAEPMMADAEIEDLTEGAEVGTTMTLELIEMTDAEWEALPEFEGW